MDWKFWNRNQENIMEKRLNDINEKLNQVLQNQREGSFSRIEQTLKENTEQINRYSRLQYKTSQELLKKITTLYSTVEDLSNVSMTGHESIKITALENRYFTLVSTMLQSVDNIDIILLNQQQQIPEEWERFLSSFQNSILDSLRKTGIQEIPLLGTTFSSFFAECVDSISPSQQNNEDRVYLPYEIIAVLKRGFVSDEGEVVRKAQVITIGQNHKREESTSSEIHDLT